MFVSNISFKDYIGIIHQSMVLLMTIPFEKRMILIIRITLGVYASLMLLGEVFAGNMFDRLSTILSFIFFLIFLSSFYTIRKKCVNDSLMNSPLLLRSASFFHPDDTICNLHCRLSVGYENNGLIFLLFFKHF